MQRLVPLSRQALAECTNRFLLVECFLSEGVSDLRLWRMRKPVLAGGTSSNKIPSEVRFRQAFVTIRVLVLV